MASVLERAPEALTAEDRAALVEQVRRLLADRCTEADVRRTMDTAEGWDRDLWATLAELGVVGMIVAPEHGGAGLGAIEMELVMEAAGAALLPSPLLSSGVLAAGLLRALDDAAACSRLLPGIAAGSTIATVALTGPAADWTQGSVAVTASGGRLTGRACFVTDAAGADVILVVAHDGDDIAVFEVAHDAAGLEVTPLPVFDRTRRLADLTFADTPARRFAGTRPAWDAVSAALDLAVVALAGEQAGGTRAIFQRSVAYARERYQFGRAIGSFQAVKHMATDLLLEAESATSAARNAAERLAARGDDPREAVALAAFACADAFTTTAATAIQMHGGIAFTWEHPAHLYLRRARSAAQLFGAPAAWRERFVRALEAK